MVHIDSLATFAQNVKDLIDANALALGIKAVYYGDQNKIPVVPAVCVEPTMKSRQLAGAPRMAENRLEVYVLIYHARLQDVQVTRKECDEFAEDVERVLHADAQLSGTVIHSMVEALESGYAKRSGTEFRSSRLTFAALTKTLLPYSAA